MVDNTADYHGGGISVLSYSRLLTIRNRILWGNTAGSGGDEIRLAAVFPRVDVAYCDVEGGQGGALVEGGTLIWDYDSNIDEDPLFETGDYHLLADSPCINAGDPDFVPEEGGKDIDGDDRVQEGRVDMGADEFVFE